MLSGQNSARAARQMWKECRSFFSTTSSRQANNNVAPYTRQFSVKRHQSSSMQQPDEQKAGNKQSSLRRPSVPFRDYEAVYHNSLNAISRQDVALDQLLSRHRPIFLMDLAGSRSRTGTSNSPWFQSASGASLDNAMKDVPDDVVERLQPFQEQKPMQADEFESDALLESHLEKSLKAKFKDMQVVMPDGSSASLVLVNANDKVMTQQPKKQQEQEFSVSPVAKSFLRPPQSVELTSVMRKRRTKMNRHKYKKRRKVQRAMRRKLNK